jgi:dihydrolipoamide dehydrogenase
MGEMTCKVLVIGGGPGGYIAAIRAGQLGLDTIIVESGKLGGTCLNIGCIPSKAVIHAAEAYHAAVEQSAEGGALGISVQKPSLDLKQTMVWKDGIVGRLNSGVAGLLKKNKVRTVRGKAEMIDGKTCHVESDTGPQTIRAEHIVLATGSEPVELKSLPFAGPVVSSTGALSLTAVPKQFVVVGAGYIGLELGTAYAKLGSKVTVVEAADRILPLYDAELTKPVHRRLEALGMTILTGAKAEGMNASGKALKITKSDGTAVELPADAVLVAVGRRPRTAGFGLEKLDLTMNGAFIRIDEHCATSMRNVWAIGDVTGEPMLAHRAMAQGEMVAEIIAGEKRVFDKVGIAAVCFTDPEIVTVGLSPAEAKQKGYEVKTGLFPFTANGRAMTKHGEDGFVRAVARADNHLVVGLQAVGQGVSELSTAFGLALEMGARLEDIAGTIHAHPTQGEALQEAALKALGHALHI